MRCGQWLDTWRRGAARGLDQNPKTDTEEIRVSWGQKSWRGGEDDAQELHTEEQIVPVLRQVEAEPR
ncbi:MAG: hypothetical protein NVS1B11_19960 [Terriglobales bacterium]